MGIFYLSNCKSNPGFPFCKMKACVVASQLCSILVMEQVKHTGSCCTELWRFQISSVTDLQKLALTANRTTLMFCVLYFFYPVKNKHLNTLLSCTDWFLNTIQQRVVRPYNDTYMTLTSHPVISFRHRLQHANQRNTHQLEQRAFLFFLTACNLLNLITYFLCMPPGSHFTILI